MPKNKKINWKRIGITAGLIALPAGSFIAWQYNDLVTSSFKFANYKINTNNKTFTMQLIALLKLVIPITFDSFDVNIYIDNLQTLLTTVKVIGATTKPYVETSIDISIPFGAINLNDVSELLQEHLIYFVGTIPFKLFGINLYTYDLRYKDTLKGLIG